MFPAKVAVCKLNAFSCLFDGLSETELQSSMILIRQAILVGRYGIRRAGAKAAS
jgi:hypothetical protein